MDAHRRAALRDRRALARLRAERVRESAFFRTIAHGLCDAGVRQFCKVPAAVCTHLWSHYAHLPGEDERLAWPRIAGGACRWWTSPAERDRLLADALDLHAPGATRVIAFHHDREAGIRLRPEDLRAHADLILRNTFEVLWIMPADGAPWLIELSRRDSAICHGRDLSPIAAGRG